MGCVSSKKSTTLSPAFDDIYLPSQARPKAAARSGPLRVSGPLAKIREEPEKEARVEEDEDSRKKLQDFDDHSGKLRALKRGDSGKNGGFSINFGRSTECEQVAAGWPAWLSSVAAEAIDGWVPLRSDSFERLDKIGQGTYSNVYRARDLKTGKMVAVKKVRFDNFQPESVRFMAREILILRKLDHPNVMKLEGIITSRLSCSIYLVFEYMEHDLAGLLSCPDIKFTESQVKCYMKQLLSGMEHCHSRGVMHRDIKSSNILVNNEGILKIADFGLANFVRTKNKQSLTSRVVTLWYRPPELLLGSTDYGEAVDLWSIGCVFAELFIGRPVLKGRNEVEQLHKIFKLCGSPPDEYWKRSKLPLAAMFKPQQPYGSTLRERCKEFPKGAVSLIETLLAIEPEKRGSALSALKSEYFSAKPYACDPSSMPKHPPNKEIDAKIREEVKRKNGGAAAWPEAVSRKPRKIRKPLQESSDFCKVNSAEEVDANVRRNHGGNANTYRRRAGMEPRPSMKQPYDTKSDVSQISQASMESQTSVHSLPMEVTTSSGFAWAKRHKQQDVFTRLHHQPISRSQKFNASDPSNILESDGQENDTAKCTMRRGLNRHDSFDSSDVYVSQDLSENYGNKKKGRVAFSGPLTYQSQESRQYDQHRQAPRRSRFYKD